MAFITQEEMVLIKKGFVPQQMEQKWFIYYSDSHLYFVRSWTGFTVYIVRFNEEGDEATAVDFQANRDPEQYRETDDARDTQMLTSLIDMYLLYQAVFRPSECSLLCTILAACCIGICCSKCCCS